MTVLESDYQAVCEELERAQLKINAMAENSARQAATITNLREAVTDLTKERDMLRQKVSDVHHYTDLDFEVQQ